MNTIDTRLHKERSYSPLFFRIVAAIAPLIILQARQRTNDGSNDDSPLFKDILETHRKEMEERGKRVGITIPEDKSPSKNEDATTTNEAPAKEQK
jgi:hypothetical protein